MPHIHGFMKSTSINYVLHISSSIEDNVKHISELYVDINCILIDGYHVPNMLGCTQSGKVMYLEKMRLLFLGSTRNALQSMNRRRVELAGNSLLRYWFT